MISIIVPCYNEQEALPLFHKEITRVLQEMGESYELLLVNDGSRDSTLDVMRTLAQKDGHVVYLSFSRNFGKEAAMYAGFCNAQGDYVAVMDADLQDPPALLPKMLELLQTGEYDSVATRRVSPGRRAASAQLVCAAVLPAYQQDLRCRHRRWCPGFPADAPEHGGCHPFHERV